jgi:hypothetical protein
MADEKKDLKNTHTFKIDLSLTSGDFSGTFTVHRPTIAERIRIGNIEARELEGLANADLYTSNLAHMVALFDVVVDEKPTWFIPRELHDVEVLQAVYKNYVDFLNEFQKKPGPEASSTGTA